MRAARGPGRARVGDVTSLIRRRAAWRGCNRAGATPALPPQALPQLKPKTPEDEAVGMVFKDAAGNFYFRAARMERVKSGGAPKKILRDVALTLHFEYLTLIKAWKKTAAYDQTAELFDLKDPEKRIAKIVKNTRSTALLTFTKVCAIDLPTENGGLLLAAFVQRDDRDGVLKGYAVMWGEREAQFLRMARPATIAPQ